MYTILGAGLAGLSTSFHLGHQNCKVFEKRSYHGGHIHSTKKNGFTWDEGPHVSFTKHDYVKALFAESTNNNFLEYPVVPTNYFKGHWINHPAQSNLYAVPEPLRTLCLEDFLSSRDIQAGSLPPKNYEEWLYNAFGKTFSESFPAAYTKKYWTLSPAQLTTDWVGERVFYPEVATVKKGFLEPLKDSTHYITSVRYPASGGFLKYADSLVENANVLYNHEVSSIQLENKEIRFFNGTVINYEKLISTLPLPLFIKLSDAPEEIKRESEKLRCSELLLINIEIAHLSNRTEQWLYVYDEDKFATRINFTDLLSPNNAPVGKSGIQVEVYFSKYREKHYSDEYYAKTVISELIEMGLINSLDDVDDYHTLYIPYANVIFDHNCKKALDKIFDWLSNFGLRREDDDVKPMTNWGDKFEENTEFGDLILAGRFGQWKYYWTDDCVLRGLLIKKNLIN